MYLLAGVAGAAAVQLLPGLPGRQALYGALLVALAVAALARLPCVRAWRGVAVAGGAALAAVLGFSHAVWQAEIRLANGLDREHENLVTRLTIQVTSLATRAERGQRFEARVLHAPVAGVPSRVLVGWYGRADAPLVVPGQVYSVAVVLKRPHGAWNPHAFDFEAWMFERGLRAGATVRGSPRLLDERPWSDAGVAVQRMRHHLRAALRRHVDGTRYGAVIIALAMGDQASVDKSDWTTFSRTGITHLVSISGLHVTMLAGIGGWVALSAWKRMSWRGVAVAERLPAQVVAAAAALLVAWLYCLVAGWGVPAQRTFFMLATVAATAILRLPLSPSRVLVAAAALVVFFDPWAPLAPGFWLSFGAVAVLMLAGSGRWRAPVAPRWQAGLKVACVIQMAITIALVPLLALQFQEVSFASPLANALAIPVVSFIVTPLALGGMLLAPLPLLGGLGGALAKAAEWIFGWMMWPIEWLGAASLASLSVAAPPWPLVVLGCMGVVHALLPRGVPGRLAAWLLVLPVFGYQPGRPAAGEWRMAVLDVGQGGAVVIETARHVVVYDTGPPFGADSDAGQRIVWPYLRARGLRRIDDLIVSHADADHAGGVAALLDNLRVGRARASYDFPQRHRAGALPFSPCAAGQGWVLDGVAFRFLHPRFGADLAGDTNANSCVLRVQGIYHSALLPGDIGVAQERTLIAGEPDAARADVVLMPHHGSKTSSSTAFVETVRPVHAVAQAGYLSRFGHPRPEIVSRWESGGAVVHRSDLHGGIIFVSDADGLTAIRHREHVARYWHGR